MWGTSLVNLVRIHQRNKKDKYHDTAGGPMREDEVVIFEANPYHQDAVKIWKWDDHGKDLGGETKSFIDYAPMLQKIVDRHFS